MAYITALEQGCRCVECIFYLFFTPLKLNSFTFIFSGSLEWIEWRPYYLSRAYHDFHNNVKGRVDGSN